MGVTNTAVLHTCINLRDILSILLDVYVNGTHFNPISTSAYLLSYFLDTVIDPINGLGTVYAINTLLGWIQ